MPLLQPLLFLSGVLKFYLLETPPLESSVFQLIPLNTLSMTKGLPDLKNLHNRNFIAFYYHPWEFEDIKLIEVSPFYFRNIEI